MEKLAGYEDEEQQGRGDVHADGGDASAEEVLAWGI
jgi:hypothetical protein